MPAIDSRLPALPRASVPTLLRRAFDTFAHLRRRLPTHYIYYALAAVDLLAIAVSLALSHGLNTALSAAVASNLTWGALHEQHAALRQHLTAAHSSIQDHLVQGSSAADPQRLVSPFLDFQRTQQRLSAALAERLPPDRSAAATNALAAIGSAFAGFAEATAMPPVATAEQRARRSIQQALALDGAYAEVVDRIDELGGHIRSAEHDAIDASASALAKLQWIERVIMALIVLMVFCIAFYGRRLDGKFQLHSEKLRTLNATLETRIAERTQELKSANASIIVLNQELTEDIAALEAARADLLHSTVLLQEQHNRFDAALENMSQGLAWFDGSMTLIICNRRYQEMYHLPDHLTVPGTTFADIFRFRANNNLYPQEMHSDALDAYYKAISERRPWQRLLALPDGRHILVSHSPMANGGSLSTHADVTEHRRLEEQVAFLAAHDALTGLPNRRRLAEEIDKSFNAVRNGGRFALLCLDLDHFKRVNDTLGHGVGVRLLTMVAQRLRDNVRATDVVARFGGDEFAIVLNGGAGRDEAAELAERLLKDISACYEIDGHRVVIGTSIGIAEAPRDSGKADDLLRSADLALYVAKSQGRGAFRLYETDMDASARERRALEIDLRQAAEAEAFDVHYQPLLEASTRELHGFEALLRWTHATRGAVPPLDFIPLAEEIGLMGRIGGIVLKKACIEAARWPEHLRIAVNVSAAQFVEGALERDVMTALAESGLTPNRLELEITESILLECSAETMAMLQRLRNVGIRLAMDDFGTGYSSFSYLRHLPFTTIKIDRSFIKDVVTEKNTQSIIQAIVKLAQCLGMSTTAEGIETEEQLSCIKRSGCSEVQGYLFSRPMPPAAVEDFVAQHDTAETARVAA